MDNIMRIFLQMDRRPRLRSVVTDVRDLTAVTVVGASITFAYSTPKRRRQVPQG